MCGWTEAADQITAVLRQVEVALGNGKTNPQACRAEASITEQTFYRGRNLTAG